MQNEVTHIKFQEAFFGRDLLDTSLSRAAQDLNSSSDDDDKDKADDKTMTLSQELKEIQQMSVKEEKKPDTSKVKLSDDLSVISKLLTYYCREQLILN